MKNWYKSAQMKNIDPSGLDRNEYIADVEINISGGTSNIEIVPISPKVNIKYHIDMDQRTWGIKGVEVYVYGGIDIEVKRIVYADDGIQGTESETILSVDMERLNHEERSGDGVYIEGIDLNVTPDFKVNYDLSSLKIVK